MSNKGNVRATVDLAEKYVIGTACPAGRKTGCARFFSKELPQISQIECWFRSLQSQRMQNQSPFLTDNL